MIIIIFVYQNMVLVVVQGEKFNLNIKDIEGSKTIENLLDYGGGGEHHQNVGVDIPIPITVNLGDWYKYLDFLNHDEATIAALKVIDYLDNVDQARLWCNVGYTQLKQQNNINKYIDANIDFNTIRQTINQYTEFIPEQVLPFELLVDFEDMLQRIKEWGNRPLPNYYIKHIVYTLYSVKIAGVYYNVSIVRLLEDITNNYTSYFKNHLILQSYDEQIKILDDNIILRQGDYNYYDGQNSHYVIKLLGDAQLISPRVGQYYQDITTYSLSCENLIYCPNNSPYIKSWRGRGADDPSNVMYATCSNEIVSGQTGTRIDLYHPNGSYKPRFGFQTGIKIGEELYDLITYNSPSCYNRDYYAYLPYEWDPIAKVVYAFSV